VVVPVVPVRRGTLAVLCAAQFVLILDVAIVNVALVPMAGDLGVPVESLQLVGSVYAACFGGALLVGDPAADGGRRRATFVTGLLVFACGSALCGAAWSVPAVACGRAVQGLGAALASPAALSLLTTSFAGAARASGRSGPGPRSLRPEGPRGCWPVAR
jgi:MFS family permease